MRRNALLLSTRAALIFVLLACSQPRIHWVSFVAQAEWTDIDR